MSSAEAKRSPARKLFLIDGSSLAYRAFFALPESIATSTGEPTGAIFGLASMLVKVISEYGLQPTLVAWDSGYTGRKELYPEYKAQRASRPDLLRQQWPHFQPLVESFGYLNLQVDGYEADDVIASVVTQVQRQRDGEEPLELVIVTGDRDAFQLIDEQTRVLATARGITDTKLYDTQAVIDRWGIPPQLVPDFIGLKGDTSDNIPGVPGIGEKTAGQLLQQFGSLEGVLANIDEVTGAKRKQNLTEHAEDARLSKQLATQHRDVPVQFDLEALLRVAPDRARLRETFRTFELRAPLRRLEELFGPDLGMMGDGGEAVVEAVASAGAAARPVTVDELVSLAAGDGELALAVRAPAVDDGALFGDAEGLTFAVYEPGGDEVLTGECADAATAVTALGERPLLVHDAKSLGTVPARLAHDTAIAAYLLDPARRSYELPELLSDRGIAVALDEPAAADAVALPELARQQREEIDSRDMSRLLNEIELPLVPVLRSLELAGSKLDTERLAQISQRLRDEARALESEIYELAGEEFMLGSPRQVEAILFEKLGLSRKRRGKTGYSTDARVLQAIRDEHPIVPKIERWRELTKLVATYLDALPALIATDGRIHTTFHQTAVATGRLSSSNPNLQNIPIRTPLGREIRACFVAEPGNLLVSADYSQVELRLLAHIAGEEALREIFRAQQDVHTATACRVFGVEPDQVDGRMRSKAKMVNYGIVYGLSAYGLADRLDIPQSEAEDFIKRYMDGFPAVSAFIERTIAQATEQGYACSLFGRRRPVPELRARRYDTRKQGERFAVNMVVQGTAADIMKIAMVRAQRALERERLATRMVLQIHDELLFEGPAAEAEQVRDLAVREMAAAFTTDPPLKVEAGIGADWLAAK